MVGSAIPYAMVETNRGGNMQPAGAQTRGNARRLWLG